VIALVVVTLTMELNAFMLLHTLQVRPSRLWMHMYI
jgi:hypothetical protein